jgi:hypothetical protein
MTTQTEIRIEKNTNFLKSNRDTIIAEINDAMGYFPYRTYNVSLKETMTVLLNEVGGYADYSIDNLSGLVTDAIATANNNKALGDIHPEDLARASARRQAVNL